LPPCPSMVSSNGALPQTPICDTKTPSSGQPLASADSLAANFFETLCGRPSHLPLSLPSASCLSWPEPCSRLSPCRSLSPCRNTWARGLDGLEYRAVMQFSIRSPSPMVAGVSLGTPTALHARRNRSLGGSGLSDINGRLLADAGRRTWSRGSTSVDARGRAGLRVGVIANGAPIRRTRERSRGDSRTASLRGGRSDR
jgi:hypothetical protein